MPIPNTERDEKIYRLFKPVDGSEPMLQKEIAELFDLSPIRIRVIVWRVSKRLKEVVIEEESRISNPKPYITVHKLI